jgi:hypothetical protein
MGRRGEDVSRYRINLRKRVFCKLKKDALDSTVWRFRFGSCYGTIVRHTTGRMNERKK